MHPLEGTGWQRERTSQVRETSVVEVHVRLHISALESMVGYGHQGTLLACHMVIMVTIHGVCMTRHDILFATMWIVIEVLLLCTCHDSVFACDVRKVYPEI